MEGKGKARPKATARPAARAARVPAAPLEPRAEPIGPQAITEMFTRFQRREPEPTSELTSVNAFTLLVAVVLSAQATDASVNLATPALFALADTPDRMAALGEERVRDLIKTIGLYRTKARNVIALSERLVQVYGGEVPRSREALETLPGVGRKTANVILNTAFGEPLIAVDTHIFRVANRTGLAPGKDVRVVEDALVRLTPAEFLHDAHHWLLLHGRYVCKARRPECWHCAIEPLCEFRDKTPAPDEDAGRRKTVKAANVVRTPATASRASPPGASPSGTSPPGASPRRRGAKRTIDS